MWPATRNWYKPVSHTWFYEALDILDAFVSDGECTLPWPVLCSESTIKNAWLFLSHPPSYCDVTIALGTTRVVYAQPRLKPRLLCAHYLPARRASCSSFSVEWLHERSVTFLARARPKKGTILINFMGLYLLTETSVSTEIWNIIYSHNDLAPGIKLGVESDQEEK